MSRFCHCVPVIETQWYREFDSIRGAEVRADRGPIISTVI